LVEPGLLESGGVGKVQTSSENVSPAAKCQQRQRHPRQGGIAEFAVVHEARARNHREAAQNNLLLTVDVIVQALAVCLRRKIEVAEKTVFILGAEAESGVGPAALHIVALIFKTARLMSSA